MFKFGFRRARKELRIPKGVYKLHEQEMERFVSGGTPVRQAHYPGAPHWVRSMTNGLGRGEGYARYTWIFPGPQWQSSFNMTTGEEDEQMTNLTYYRD